MSNQTNNRPTLAVPTAEGVTDAVEAILSAHSAGQWILISPDGRLWINGSPMNLFAVLAAEMRGDGLKFGTN